MKLPQVTLLSHTSSTAKHWVVELFKALTRQERDYLLQKGLLSNPTIQLSSCDLPTLILPGLDENSTSLLKQTSHDIKHKSSYDRN